MTVQRPRGNVPKSPLRWTIERASHEFKIAPATLRKILQGTEPDQGGCYPTEQICRCLFGDLQSEKIRKERELTKKYQLENAITEAAFVNRVELMKGFAALADAMTSRIMSSNVDRSVKEDLLNDLAGVPLILENVAHAQTKLRRGGNGNGSED